MPDSEEEKTFVREEATVTPASDGVSEDGPVTEEAPGRYSIRREYGRGGMSRVLLAFDAHIGREVALKELLLADPAPDGTPRSQSQAASTRFLREARITGQLDHPNIVPVYEVGRHQDGTFYYTQKLVRGRTLKAALRACASLADRLKLLAHFADVCHAVAYAHARGVIHRDLKPDNVMVGEFGETVVLDWGLAKARGQKDYEAKKVEREALLLRTKDATLAGHALGTPSYMSPEQALGELEQIDERSDVWSLGAVLYEILTGAPPFEGDTAYSIISKVIHEQVRPVKHVLRGAPPELAAVAQRALSRDKTQRYATAEELAAEIDAYQAGGNVRAYQYSSLELLRRFVQRNKTLSGVVALAVVLLLAALVAIRIEAVRAGSALVEARRNLASAYLEKAHAAEHEFLWHRAEIYYAAARVQDDTQEARWGTMIEGGEAAGVTRITGPNGWVTTVAFSPDGESVAAGSFDATARIFDVATGRELWRMQGQELVETVRFSPDGKLLATRDTSGTVRLSDVKNGALVAKAQCPGSGIGSLAFDGGTLLASCPEGTLSIANGVAAKLSWPSTRLANCKPGKWLVSEPKRVLLREGVSERVLGEVDEGRHAVACSPKAGAAAAVKGGAVLRWDASGKPLPALSGHTAMVASMRFSPDGDSLATASYDRTVRLWDVASGKELEQLQRPAPALWVDFAPDGETVAVGERTSAVLLWSPAASYAETAGEGEAFAFTGDGGHLAASGDRVARFGADGKLVRAWEGKVTALSAAGKRFVAVRADGALGEGDLDGALRFGPPGAAVSAQIFDDGAVLAQRRDGSFTLGALTVKPPMRQMDGWTATRDTLWRRLYPSGLERIDLHTGAEQTGLGVPASAAAVSRDGALLAVGSYAGVRVVKAADLSTVAELEMDGAVPTALAFSSDARLLAGAGIDGAVHLYDVATRKEIGHLPVAGAFNLTGLRFSPDGRVLRIGAMVRRDAPAQGRFVHLGDPGSLRAPEIELRETLSDHGVALRDGDVDQLAPPVSAQP